MLADCGMLATNQFATLCFQSAAVLQTASSNQIPITQTTDLILMDEFLHCLPSREEGSFELFRSTLFNEEASPAIVGLRIWRDGQLIFAQSGECESLDAAASVVQHSETIEVAVDETAQRSPETPAMLGEGEFFTLKVPNRRLDWDLQSPGISGDHDVFPIVESVTSLRADVRQFQQSGRTTGSDSGGTERVYLPEADSTSDSDSLISRAKRRLDDRTAVTDSTIVALQIAPDARASRAGAADSEEATVATSHPRSAPQFSRLFTRLWENRRRAAGQAETDH